MIKLSSVVTPPLHLGFDPGKDKCGLAIVDAHKRVHWHQVVLTDQVCSTLTELCEQWTLDYLILGDQTHSKTWQKTLEQTLPRTVTIVRVDERYSSLEARSRYWEFYPPSFWQKLIPQGLRQPPRPVDDIVAIVLVERFLGRTE
ncbi:MAG: Holliday junction resolvase RuvX [Prochlorotrichaceae cyanobacterium]|jgi:RNase H-fold protein (predicted Holliday junction resolvase)